MAPPEPSTGTAPSGGETAKQPSCIDVGIKAFDLVRDARTHERRAPSTLFAQEVEDADHPSRPTQAREQAKRACLDEHWSQQVISCFLAATSVEGAQTCLTHPNGATAETKPPICAGIARALAAAPTFDSIKGDKVEVDAARAAALTEWKTTNEVPGTVRCGVAQAKGIGSPPFYYCLIAEGPSDDAHARELFAQVAAQIDTCDRPAEWARFPHAPNRLDSITDLVTAMKWRPPGDRPALGVELRLTTDSSSDTTYRLRVDVHELPDTK